MSNHNVLPIVLSSLAWLCVVIAVWPLLRLLLPYRITSKNKKRKGLFRVHDSGNTATDVSVIVYCDNNAQGLENVITMLKEQTTEGNTEIIIACDPVNESLKDMCKILHHTYPDIYITYVPEDTKNISRKKLALNLGIKAARNDILIFVDSNTLILSDNWLDSVKKGFNSGTEILIAPVKPMLYLKGSVFNLARLTDYVIDTLTWISAAIRGHCFRGHSYNLAYRKSLFLRHNGFSSSLNYHYGDDDMFISRVAEIHNVQVNIDDVGLIGITYNSVDELEREMRRRMFTIKGIGRGSRIVSGMLYILIWVNFISGLLGIVYGSSSLLLMLLAIFAIVFMWLMLSVIMIFASRFIDVRLNPFQLISGFFVSPFLYLQRYIKMYGERSTQMTWVRLKK